MRIGPPWPRSPVALPRLLGVISGEPSRRPSDQRNRVAERTVPPNPALGSGSAFRSARQQPSSYSSEQPQGGRQSPHPVAGPDQPRPRNWSGLTCRNATV
jgi:hypothetical protein